MARIVAGLPVLCKLFDTLVAGRYFGRMSVGAYAKRRAMTWPVKD
jgi:hypothetical protein